MRLRYASIALALISLSIASADPLNLLFYGNSFTIGTGFGSTRSVNALVRDIAVAAGEPQPFVVSAAVAGQSLDWHDHNNTAIITTSIPPGQHWDYVVLQDYSTQPTHIGNLALHRSSYAALFGAVRDHSPAVQAIGFETWARAPGHSYYTGGSPPFPGGPAQMQQELRDGYALSTADVNALYGAGTSRVAAVGDAWENADWQNLHYTDLYHANNRGTLLTALMLYGTIYQDMTVSDIDLSGVLSSLDLSAADGAFLAGIADATLPEPSSGLLLAMGVSLLLRRQR